MSALMTRPVQQAIKLSAPKPDPSPEEVAEMATELQLAAFNGISPDDMKAIMVKATEQAKEGNAAARRFIFDYIGHVSPRKARVIEHRHKAIGSLAKQFDAQSIQPAEQPKPKSSSPALLTIEAPVVGVLRRCVARLLLTGGRTGVSTIAAEIDSPVSLVTEICDHEWFHTTSEGVDLTPVGRQAVG